MTVLVSTTDGTASSASDYTALSNQLVTIPAGQTSATITLNVVNTTANDGYYLYEAPDLEKAITLAARIPAARMGGTVEVRCIAQLEC